MHTNWGTFMADQLICTWDFYNSIWYMLMVCDGKMKELLLFSCGIEFEEGFALMENDWLQYADKRASALKRVIVIDILFKMHFLGIIFFYSDSNHCNCNHSDFILCDVSHICFHCISGSGCKNWDNQWSCNSLYPIKGCVESIWEMKSSVVHIVIRHSQKLPIWRGRLITNAKTWGVHYSTKRSFQSNLLPSMKHWF